MFLIRSNLSCLYLSQNSIKCLIVKTADPQFVHLGFFLKILYFTKYSPVGRILCKYLYTITLLECNLN